MSTDLPESSLISYTREDDIHVFRPLDMSHETVAQWVLELTNMLNETTGPKKRLYDLREIKDVPLRVVKIATEVRRHPNIRFNYVAFLITNHRVQQLIDLIIKIAPGGRLRIFTDENEAVEWLHSYVPKS